MLLFPLCGSSHKLLCHKYFIVTILFLLPFSLSMSSFLRAFLSLPLSVPVSFYSANKAIGKVIAEWVFPCFPLSFLSPMPPLPSTYPYPPCAHTSSTVLPDTKLTPVVSGILSGWPSNLAHDGRDKLRTNYSTHRPVTFTVMSA